MTLKNAAERRESCRFRVCKRSSLFLFTRVVKSCFHIQNDVPARTRTHGLITLYILNFCLFVCFLLFVVFFFVFFLNIIYVMTTMKRKEK